MGGECLLGASRFSQFILILVLTALCTGCWDSTEIERLAIVMASGADLVQDGNSPEPMVLVTLQMARASELGSTGGGTPARSTGTTEAFILEQAEGQDAVAALEKIRKKLSRKLFMGHRRVLILGEDYAKNGVYDLLDEIVRNPQSRLRTDVVVAYHDTAQSILELPYAFNRLPANAIVDFEQQGSMVQVDAKQFIQSLTSKGDPFAMGIEPVHSLHQVSKKSPESFALTHIAVFQKDRLVGWLDGRELEGFRWINGRMKRADVTVSIPGYQGKVSARMLQLRTIRHVNLVRGKPHIDIKLRAEFDIAENGTVLDLNNSRNMDKVRSAIKDEITEQMRSALDVLQHKYDADPFGFADQINKRYPNVWRRLQPNWRQSYSQIPVSFQTDVNIRNSGLTGPPLQPARFSSGSRGRRSQCLA